MEAENFLATGFGTRVALESISSGWERLDAVARTWQPLRLKGIQVSPEFGTPFVAATQVFDVRPSPRKWLSLHRTKDYSQRFVSKGTILVTCSGSVGRATLSSSALDGVLVSHDLLRIEVKDSSWWGWVYAYLRAPTVREMMKAAQYGHIIKHLETHHLDCVPVVKLRKKLRAEFNEKASRIIELRDEAHSLVNKAEEQYALTVGAVPTLEDGMESFESKANEIFGRGRRLDANYHNPLARAAEVAIHSTADRIDRLADVVADVFVPGRFKHVYGDGGVPYLDSAQIMELAPDVDKRVLSLKGEERAGYLVSRGTLLVPCSGQLHGIIGSVVLATEWHEGKVLSNHILRIVPKAGSDIRIGYLQAVLAHPVLGRPRLLKCAFGSSVPELAPGDIGALSVPRLSSAIEHDIADKMERAAELRAVADELEEVLSAEAERYLDQFLDGHDDHIES